MENRDASCESSIDEGSHKDLKKPVCGIIMPISDTDGYPIGHWNDVYSILCESARWAGFEPKLVSIDKSESVVVIHKSIVQNIYDNPIVICDISSRNANVMLELGMRLAFDKPVIIVKDDKTPFSFDISPIEHLHYPSDLRYKKINEFELLLKEKIVNTYKASQSDVNHSTFLKNYGTFVTAKIDEKEVSMDKFILNELGEMKRMLISASSLNGGASVPPENIRPKDVMFVSIRDYDGYNVRKLYEFLVDEGVPVKDVSPHDEWTLEVRFKYDITPEIKDKMDDLIIKFKNEHAFYSII